MMRVFVDRNSEDFRNFISSMMEVESLKQTAVTIKEPEKVNGITYTKCIRIDLMGMCSSLFFDRSHEITQFDLYDALVNLIRSSDQLSKEGIFIKIRVLLLYPFCISALTRMYAEFSTNRASISEPAYPRDFTVLDDLSERDFWGSSFNVTQQTVLSQINELRSLISNVENWSKSNNQFLVQYTPTHININYIQLNNTVFVEPYVYAKENRHSRRCSIATPVTVIDDESKCRLFEDNFRYLWQNDVTIVEDDAIEIKNGRPHILPPQSIKYQNKSSNIKKRLIDSKQPDKDADINKLERNWVNYVTHHLMYRFCDKSLFQIIPENIFITCSWKTVDGTSSPHPIAQEIKSFFSKCIRKDAHILEATTRHTLSKQVYDSLDASEAAIVLLTKDACIEDTSFSRPNIYIELGYLLKQVGRENVLIIAENGVYIPTDIQDIPRFEYTDQLYLILPKIIKCLLGMNIIHSNNLQEVKTRLQNYLQDKLVSGYIAQNDFNCVIKQLSTIA